MSRISKRRAGAATSPTCVLRVQSVSQVADF